MPIDWTAIATILTAAGGVAIALDARKTARERSAERAVATADAGESAAESVRLLLDPLNARIATLETLQAASLNREKQLHDERLKREQAHKEEIGELIDIQTAMQKEVDELRGGIAVLVSQLETARIVPRWRPQAKPGTGPLGAK